jgi:hypothetical protein
VREQKKFEKAIKVHGTIQQIKADDDEHNRLKTERRQKKLKQIERETRQRMRMIGEERDKLEAKRKQVLYKKEELQRSQLQEQFEVERALRERMRQLDAKQRLRQETLSLSNQNGFREKDKERRRHSVERVYKESNEAQICSKTLNTLKDKLEQSFSKSFEYVQRRVELNKQHAGKVEATLNQVIQNDQRRVNDQLQKVVLKSKVSTHKQSVKEAFFKDKVHEVAQELQDKFSKQSQAFSSVEDELRRKDKEIEARRQKKEELKVRLLEEHDTQLIRRIEKHQLRQQDQAENYGRALIAQQKNKEKVLQKHRQAKDMADLLSTEKTSLADKSVRDTLHLQRLRTAGSPGRLQKLSPSLQVATTPEVK